MSQLPQLIAYEEIYDLDTFQLEDMLKLIKSQSTDDQQWNKKAKKILDLIELELKERLAIENFAFNIKFEDFISQPIYQNNALQAILNDIKNRPANYLDANFAKPPLPHQEQPQEKQTTHQVITKPSSDAMSTSTMTRSTHGRQQPKKVNQMQEFMKDVLKKTDVSNQQFVIGAAVNHRYVPPPPKPQLTTVEKIKQEKMLRKKKKKKGRAESNGKVVEHLPSIVKHQPTMQASGVNQLKQGSLDGNHCNQENKVEIKNNSQAKQDGFQKGDISIQESMHPLQKSQSQSIDTKLQDHQISQNQELLRLQSFDPKKQSSDLKEKEDVNFQMENVVNSKQESQLLGKQQLSDQQVAAEKLQISQNLQNEDSNLTVDIKLNQIFYNSRSHMQDGVKDIENNQSNIQIKNYQNKISDEDNRINNIKKEMPNNNVKQDEQNNLKNEEYDNMKKEEYDNIKKDEQLNEEKKVLEIAQKASYKESLSKHYSYVVEEDIKKNQLLGQQEEYLQQIQKLQNQEEEAYDDNFQDEGEDEDQDGIQIEEPIQEKDKFSKTNLSQDEIRENKKKQSQLVTQQPKSSKQLQDKRTNVNNKQITSQQSQRRTPNSTTSKASIQADKKRVSEQKKQTEEEEIVEDFNEVESDHEMPVKHKPLKELVGKVVGRSDQPKYKGVIEIKQKPVQTNKEKMEEINNLCKEMGLDEFKQKQPAQSISKAITPSSNNRPKNPQSKYIQKMLQFIDDSKLEDYSDILPSFSHLFSGFFNNQAHYNHLDVMREIYGIFQQHIEKVDNMDSLLGKYKSNPLSINPNELVYINDPQRLIQYSTRTGVDIQQYIQRQMVFNKRLQNDSCNQGKLERYFRVVKTKEEVYDIITRSFMRKQGWTELAHGIGLRTSWNVLWTWSKPQIDLNKLLYFQKVNHFPFNKNLGRKDLLKKNIERCQKLGAKAGSMFDIIPSTFLLPKEYVQFMEKFYKDSETEGQQNIWIMKPTGKSRGRGITVLNDISDVMYAEPVVLQKYLRNPLLLKGHKFDMRIYVLVTSFNPLEVFLYKEGFARLTTQPFTLDINDLKNQLVHLTNFAVQKTHVQIHDIEQQLGGCKISLRQLREKLTDRNIDWGKIWEQVQDIVLKSLVACQSEIPNNPNSFELFGYDIIIDSNHKCWLLEVNVSPSLARDYILDELIKQQLIDDIFDLLDSPNYDRQRLCEVLERRIQEEQGCKSVINTMNNSKLQLQRDINYILNGQHIRRYGEMPKNMGGFIRLAPSEKYDKFKSLVQSYKIINGRGTID